MLLGGLHVFNLALFDWDNGMLHGGNVGRFLLQIGMIAILITFATSVFARNTPCSGKKGGISHCQGDVFVCNDGSVSQSKRSCQAYFGAEISRMPSRAVGSDCACRDGRYCIGPRGGHYCYTDSGRKSYLPR